MGHAHGTVNRLRLPKVERLFSFMAAEDRFQGTSREHSGNVALREYSVHIAAEDRFPPAAQRGD
jgi:hypothetical protein